MLPELKILQEIQTLDQEMIELNRQLAKYPVIWEEVKKRLAKTREDLERARKESDRQSKERRRVEQKLRLFSDDLRRYQTQQNNVKTPKEYEALSKQIEAARKKIAQCEEQGLALIEKEPEVQASLEKIEEEAAGAEETYKSEKERIRGQFNEKKQRIDELKKERESFRTRVGEEALRAYETVFKRYPGSALVSVRSNSCTGCHWQLLPNELIEVHNQEQLTFCSNCGRILTEDEDFVPAQTEAG